MPNALWTSGKAKELKVCDDEAGALEKLYESGQSVMFKEDVSFYSFELDKNSFET